MSGLILIRYCAVFVQSTATSPKGSSCRWGSEKRWQWLAGDALLLPTQRMFSVTILR